MYIGMKTSWMLIEEDILVIFVDSGVRDQSREKG